MLLVADLSISQPMLTTAGAIINGSNGSYTFQLGINVTLKSEPFVSIVAERVYLNGSLIGSSILLNLILLWARCVNLQLLKLEFC